MINGEPVVRRSEWGWLEDASKNWDVMVFVKKDETALIEQLRAEGYVMVEEMPGGFRFFGREKGSKK